jgi:NagD protein
MKSLELLTRYAAGVPPGRRREYGKEDEPTALADTPQAYLMDMDGVLIRGTQLIPGADAFIERLRARGIPFLILTNNSMYTPRDLQARLEHIGLQVRAEELFTSALATAQFLHDQAPGGTAYVIGEAGLTTALHDVGYVLSDVHPDYVVLGETVTYSYQRLTVATRLAAAGARFIATNPDVVGPSEDGLVPATGAVAALIAAAAGVQPYFVGKPNPLMMRAALRHLGAHSETSVMIGDRMDTDIVAGTEAGMRTILVLSGVTGGGEVARFPYRPTAVAESVAELGHAGVAEPL